MKLEKTQWILLALTALFVTFTLAFFLGRNSINAVITTQGVLEEESTQTAPSSPQETEPVQEQETEQTPLLNLNTATQFELEELPGIGPKLAERIIAWRDANGPFVSVEQLMDVDGIAKGKFESIKDLIYVEDAE